MLVPYFYQKPIYIYLCATSPATPFIWFYALFGWLYIRLAAIHPFFSFLYVELYIKRPPLRRPSIYFSCSYSSRRGREKGLGLVFGFFRGFRYVPRSVWQVQSCVIYTRTHGERERRDSYFSYSSGLTNPNFTSPVFVVPSWEKKKNSRRFVSGQRT